MAQLPAPNAAGVTMGHHHLMVADPAVHKKIWVDILGGQPSGNAPLEFIEFPGVFLILSKGNATEGTEGSAIESIWFGVRDLDSVRDKLVAAGVKVLAKSGGPFLIMEFPDKIEVQFSEDPSLSTPIAYWGLGIRATDRNVERAWWEKVFGAETEIWFQGVATTSIAGKGLSFRQVDHVAKTQGRSFDHTGVNVRNVTEYCAKLAGIGIVCERPMGANTPIAMVTDPAGVRIEINQGLESR
jgi:hypothetical protein